MKSVTRTQRDAAEDIFFGQEVINWARWFVIAAAIALVLMTADSTTKLVLGITPVVALMAMNFYLHGRRMVEKPASAALVVTSSAVDIAVVSIVVAFGFGSGVQGLDSQFYVGYFPIVLAFAFVMPRKVAIAHAAATMGVYAVVCVIAGATNNATPIEHPLAIEGLVSRLIALAAVAGLGTFFWRIQRERRHRATA